MSLLWMVRSQCPGFSHRSERVPSSFPVAALGVRSALYAHRSRFQTLALGSTKRARLAKIAATQKPSRVARYQAVPRRIRIMTITARITAIVRTAFAVLRFESYLLTFSDH
jgi:hypothetical protein